MESGKLPGDLSGVVDPTGGAISVISVKPGNVVCPDTVGTCQFNLGAAWRESVYDDLSAVVDPIARGTGRTEIKFERVRLCLDGDRGQGSEGKLVRASPPRRRRVPLRERRVCMSVFFPRECGPRRGSVQALLPAAGKRKTAKIHTCINHAKAGVFT